MIRLIAIDLDGTLFNEKKEISERNQRAIQQAKEKGVKIVICTGRPLKAIEPVLEQLNLQGEDDYSITFNGGYIQKNQTGEVLHQLTLTKAEVQMMYIAAHANGLPVDVVSDGTVYSLTPTIGESQYRHLNTNLNNIESTMAQLPEDKRYNKVVLSAEPEELEARIPHIVPLFSDRYSTMKTQPFLYEIAPQGVQKGEGLVFLGELLQLDASEMMAIGDEENDESMLTFAGLGVAMGNASETVKQLADVITDVNTNDGVAKAIEQYVLLDGSEQ